MGLFHLKKGTPAAKALPKKSILKDGVSMCLDFCCHERKCNHPHALCKNGKYYTNWKSVPDSNKVTLLKHMDSRSLMWLDVETFKKHNITIAPKYAHLLAIQLDQSRRQQRVPHSPVVALNLSPQRT
jgi:hypothetical protein